MKTVVIGAGAGGLAVLELCAQGRLAVLDPTILAVVDRDPEAPGMRFARDRGWPTLTSIHDAMGLLDLELVIELTGDADLLDDIYFLLPPGVRVIDHVLARVFWDLDWAHQHLQEQLRQKTELEARIAEDRSRLQELLDTIPDVVMVTDPQMRIVRVNRRFEEVTGGRREDALGRRCYQAFCRQPSPATCIDGRCPFREVITTRAPVTLVHFVDEGRGRSGYYQINANPVFAADGSIAFVVETSREITEQVLLKRETEELARRFSQILEAVQAAVTIKDLDGRYTMMNPRAERLVGADRDQLIGHTAREIFGDEVGRRIEQLDDRVLSESGHRVAEEVYEFGGKEHILISERFPIFDFKGQAVAICCVSREVTRERELQRELLQTERLIAVGKLAAGVAHELNNPLTGILTFAEDLLLDCADDDPRRGDYQTIVGEAMRCRRIVRDLLDFSRRKAPRLQRLDIGPVIRQTVDMVARQASFHDVAVDLGDMKQLPPVKIDAQQIQQAILNLLINARDAMDGRGKISITAATADDHHIVIAVADTGPGIPDALRKKVFEPFFSTKGDQGNGLGLPAVVSVMDQHNGRVELDSAEGQGATFRLFFPTVDEGAQ